MPIGVATLWSVTARGLPPSAVPVNGNGGIDPVRCVNLPCARKGDTLNLYVARTKAKLPSAVLILCPDQGEDPKKLLSGPAWQDFAEDHHLGLVVVMATTGPAPVATKNTTPLPAGPSQAALVLQAVDREFGVFPILLYGGPQQAVSAESLLTANPKRITGWYLRGLAHLPEVSSATPPGIVVCYKENKSLYDALTQDFTLARKKGARLTWISLAGDGPPAGGLPALDTFVRNYLAATLSTKLGMDGWENIDTKQMVSAMDMNTHPERSSYLPQVALASAWANLHVPGVPELAQQPILEREEDTFNQAQPKLHLYLRKPLSAEKAGGKIEGVLAFCTWKKDKTELVGRLQDRTDFLVRYAEEHRLALLTWDTAQAWSTKESADQRSQQENFQDDLGFDKLANAWERGVHVLCHDAGLPEDDFLLYGISRGAQWAHRLALRKPAHFLAVHVHVNSSYDWPTPAAKNVLWLQTTGEREVGYEAAKRFYARCREMGYPIIFKAGENLGHADSEQIDKLGLLFFDYALGVKTRRDTIALNPKALHGKHTNPSLYDLSGLAEAPFYADFINQDVYGADEKDMVPAGQRVPLPTKALALAWGNIAEAPSLLPVSNPAAVPAKPSVTPVAVNLPAAKPVNYFGSSTPPGPEPAVDIPAGASVVSAANPPKQENRSGPVKPSLGPEPVPTPAGQTLAERYRLQVQKALAQNPTMAQIDALSDSALVGRSRQSQEPVNPSQIESPWSKQVAQIMKEQAAAHPSFPLEFEHSFRRAATAYPALSEVGSAMNSAFLAEYHRLDQINDGILGETTWPEQIARKVSEKPAAP